jgi:hypothetical protein
MDNLRHKAKSALGLTEFTVGVLLPMRPLGNVEGALWVVKMMERARLEFSGGEPGMFHTTKNVLCLLQFF